MKMKKVLLCLIILLAGLFLSPTCLAKNGEITDIERIVPEGISPGEVTTITLSITGERPFTAGIVEIIPAGFAFPENDAAVSDSKYFELERETGKIAFAVKDESEITYNVLPGEGGTASFEGYWVDMLAQTPELDAGKGEWRAITDPNAVSRDQEPGVAPEAGTESFKPKLGWGIFIVLILVLAGVLIWKKYYPGGSKDEA